MPNDGDETRNVVCLETNAYLTMTTCTTHLSTVSPSARFAQSFAAYGYATNTFTALALALALALTELDLPIQQVLGALSWRPAAIAGVGDTHGLPIAEGNPANLCVIDPGVTWTVRGADMASRSRNTPYEGRELRGRVRHTILHGEPVVIGGEPQR